MHSSFDPTVTTRGLKKSWGGVDLWTPVPVPISSLIDVLELPMMANQMGPATSVDPEAGLNFGESCRCTRSQYSLTKVVSPETSVDMDEGLLVSMQ